MHELPDYVVEPYVLVDVNSIIPFSDSVRFIIPKSTKSLPKTILHATVMIIDPVTEGMKTLQSLLRDEVCKESLQPLEIRRKTADHLRSRFEDHPFYDALFSSDWKMSQYEAMIKDVKALLNMISPTLCLSKWGEVTVNLARSGSHSCCRTALEISDESEVKSIPVTIHNSKVKQISRKQMLNGERPPECAYCWNLEDSSKHVSNRILLSMNHIKDFYRIIESGLGENYSPSQVEIYSTSTCQLKCFYCGPLYSSSWKNELLEESSYKLRHGVMFEVKKEPDFTNMNPFLIAYESAIKEWYPSLTTLRFTGGEPLLATQMWKMLDYAATHPSQNLTLSINSNLCVGDRRIQRLKKKLELLDGKVKEVWIHASGEATGSQMEYIRYGSNYDQWLRNIDDLLSSTKPFVKVTVMNTVNILCYNTFIKLVDDILTLRKKYGERLVLMSFKYLISPSFGDVRMLPTTLKNKFLTDLNTLLLKTNKTPYQSGLLTDSEIYSIKRLIEHVQLPPRSSEEITDLKMFFTEYDRRRGTSFNECFPELAKEIGL